MIKTLFEDIKDFLKSGNMVTKLIIINIALTVTLFLLSSVFKLNILKYFMLSNDFYWNIEHPWVLVSYLFVSVSIMNLIWNMVVLYWFGAIIGDLIGDSKILPLYIMGGIFGAIIFVILSQLFEMSSIQLIGGSSSAVMAIIVSATVLVPKYAIRLLLFGNVSLRIVAIVYIGLQFLYAVSSNNTLYFSYIGSAVFGWYYIYTIRKGKGLDRSFNLIVDWGVQLLFSSKSQQKRNLSVKYKSKNSFNTVERVNEKKVEKSKELDRILDKIKEVGYDSLTEVEKEFLFLASKD